jgi:hypothetical protein
VIISRPGFALQTDQDEPTRRPVPPTGNAPAPLPSVAQAMEMARRRHQIVNNQDTNDGDQRSK